MKLTTRIQLYENQFYINFLMETTKPPILKLTPPHKITKKDLKGINYGIRPYRKTGIRLEKENLEGKTIFHNYGHGGSGVTLAYGSASKIVNIFMNDTSKSVKKVAIIGCGYMGLFQALMLAKLGYAVNIYAKDFPIKTGMYSKDSTVITSQVAAGLWLPFTCKITDQSMHDSIMQESFNYYLNCFQKKLYHGITMVDYITLQGESGAKESAPGLLNVQRIRVDFETGILYDAELVRTLLIEGDIFLNEIYEEAKRTKNITICSKEFNSSEEVLCLEEEVIFNCTGWGSEKLFHDTNMVPYSGHIIYVERMPGVDYFMSLSMRHKDDIEEGVDLYPLSNKLGIGYSKINLGWITEPREEIIQNIIDNLNEFVDAIHKKTETLIIKKKK